MQGFSDMDINTTDLAWGGGVILTLLGLWRWGKSFVLTAAENDRVHRQILKTVGDNRTDINDIQGRLQSTDRNMRAVSQQIGDFRLDLSARNEIDRQRWEKVETRLHEIALLCGTNNDSDK